MFRRKQSIPAGFRPAPKPKPKPVAEMTLRELQDLYNLNRKILSSPYVPYTNFCVISAIYTSCGAGEHLPLRMCNEFRLNRKL
jgi:hypothetical protein